jgi:DNA-3-methyladenine glycosylase II
VIQINKALKYLSDIDPVMAKLIREKLRFNLKPNSDYFSDLISTVISQQLSFKAYKTIEKRLFDKLDNKILPDNILSLPDEQIRSCGLSNSKCGFIKNIAFFYKQNPVFFNNVHKLNDQKIFDTLIKIKGIGYWSIEMFLIFNLVRPDVFPVKDNGIRNAVKKLFGFRKTPTDKQMNKIAEKWRPYRTVATWYLWRSLDNQK